MIDYMNIGRKRTMLNVFLGAGTFLLLYFISQYNYLFFHTVAELFPVVIAWSFFIIAWNTKGIIKSDVIIFLGVAYLFIGGIDILHAFSYQGFNFIVGADKGANPATQLWIIARYMESVTLATALFLLSKKVNIGLGFITYGAFFIIAICSIFAWDIFPDCYITGSGLTPFKKYSEYTIIVIFTTTLCLLHHKRELFGKKIYPLIASALIFKILSELSFTLYVDIYGLLNFIGHVLKVISFYLMYMVLIRFGLSEPYKALFKGLSNSEKRYRQMFNTNTSVKMIISPQTASIVKVNQAACDFYGYSEDELLSMKISDINSLSPDETQREMEQAKREHKLYFNFVHQLKSGELRDVEVYSGPVKQGDDTYLYSIIHDVTDKKKNEDSLNFQSLLLNEIQDHITATDLEGNILYVNDAEIRTTKRRKEELLGKPVSIYGDDPSKGAAQNDIIEGTLKNGYWNGQVVNYDADGNEIIMFCRTKLIRDTKHQPWRMVGISTDITKQKQAEQALRESEDKFRAMFDNAPLSYQSLDQDGNFLEVNDTWLRIMGYERVEVIGKNFSIFLHPDWKEHFQVNFPRFKAVGEVLGVEFEMVKKDGSLILVSFHGKISHDEKDQFKQTHCIFRDITQESKLLEEKTKLETQLLQAHKMEAIGTLSGGIAHDFNNILSPLLGYAEMMKEDLPNHSELHDSVDEILKASLRAKDLVKQILTFSRQNEHKIKAISLQKIIDEALGLLKSSIPATIEIKTNINPKCNMVLADPTQIHQVIMNLSTNAYHAMQNSGGQLTISLKQRNIGSNDLKEHDIAIGSYAILTISDTGAGIRKEVIEKVFDPYFTTKGIGKGTGLGLSVVQGIVKQCKGAIDIYSEVGKGTNVRVFFPTMGDETFKHKNDIGFTVKGGSERILIVDDERAIAAMEKSMLQRLGYNVTAYDVSYDALEDFKNQPESYDLVISDMTMPNFTGIQLAKEIKSIRQDIPFIICTGFSDQINKHNIKELGIDAYISKPVLKNDIACLIRKLLDAK